MKNRGKTTIKMQISYFSQPYSANNLGAHQHEKTRHLDDGFSFGEL